MEPIGIQVGMGGGRGWVVAGDGWGGEGSLVYLGKQQRDEHR